ncbi:multiheme c-type cytochrome [Geotalea uraniireducens]|uniref:Outer membrane cytochrome MtrC/MtrF-like domain-containing protein n=1 Tax=Geotalea uraniireducens (strain Rf4) TaxID=351605 RepID=A5G6M5_GEOUR|nr:lipoprotein cytochrome C [Geotalea uraniireducens]ABQ27443.1 hypothetical protein Gura_3284 [Geotalea uraniireducens Rf4]
MKNGFFTSLILLSLLIAVMTGCGSDNSGSQTALSTFAASEACIRCHTTTNNISPVTGMNIVEEWKLSTHNTSNGASCIDCHGEGNGHPNSCGVCHGGSSPVSAGFHNPEQAGLCNNCHGPNHPDDVMILNSPQHFGNMTASLPNIKYRASFVSSQYVSNCRKCHNPHNPSSAIEIARQWADSGHGNTLAGARTAYDFKTRGTYEPVNLSFQNNCVRCHTTTGFINFVASGYSDQRPFAGPQYPVVLYPSVSTDKTKEVTGCNACHDDGKGNAYSYKLRALPQVRIYYNYSSANTSPTVKLNNMPVYFPDAGPSNICISCHAGRGIGRMITVAAANFFNFSTSTSISAHDFAGAGNLFQQSGYEYSGRSYTSSAFLHDEIGFNNTNSTGSRGPCITCHMKSDESHSFLPVTFDNQQASDPSAVAIAGIISRTCSKCHNGAIQPAWTAQTLQARRAGFQAALAILNGVLAQKRGSTKTWEKLDGVIIKGTGPNTMGANFNYGLLKNDWGAYAHNDLYAKRLIYDSLDWLYDRDLVSKTNTGGYATDVEAAINGVTTAKNPWNSAVIYSSPQLDGPTGLKALAINYLLGGPGGNRP